MNLQIVADEERDREGMDNNDKVVGKQKKG